MANASFTGFPSSIAPNGTLTGTVSWSGTDVSGCEIFFFCYSSIPTNLPAQGSFFSSGNYALPPPILQSWSWDPKRGVFLANGSGASGSVPISTYLPGFQDYWGDPWAITPETNYIYILINIFFRGNPQQQQFWTDPISVSRSKTVAYHNGSDWVNCIPYYHNGTTWIECAPYYHNGTTWVECSTK